MGLMLGNIIAKVRSQVELSLRIGKILVRLGIWLDWVLRKDEV